MKPMLLFAVIAGVLLPSTTLAQVPSSALRSCLAIEDQSKERLNCYDAKIGPAPNIASAAKTVGDCRFLKEEDERLKCFNRFVTSANRKPSPQKP